MYRESLLGVALASTLAELGSVCHLTEGQKEQLWDIFDAAMDRTLADVPVMSQVRVFAPPPSLLAESSDSGCGGGDAAPLSTTPKRMMFPAPTAPPAAEASVVPRCNVVDDGTTYPVYRAHDGMWTILLKGPTVEVKDGSGCSETIHLDYLKVHLKDVAATETAGATSSTSMVATGKKRRR
ncbi:hypothetical protein DQ04_00571120 [Trypanosoma grayi]|uniref:hypothetical protein n=1 Tax=Trypanosoma grayi TaxID=71804 RepID=UPI0004F44D28|nr:hypothetical protein DQ04_00571120 [Trypanosoma grayi]KEG14217.1 hypothetical protein DQ04_00571120 [Trypanosoma grayi]